MYEIVRTSFVWTFGGHQGIKEAVKDITGTASKAVIDCLIREGE